MRKRLLIILSLLLVGLADCQAQDTVMVLHKNSLYLELLGNAITPSINYERFIYKKERPRYAFRIGVTPIHQSGKIDSMKIVWTLFMPVTFSVFLGKGSSTIELGAGADIAPLPDDQFALPHPEILGTLVAGYRYMPAGKRILLRATYTPFFGRLGPNWGHIKNAKGYGVYYHFGGISIGRRF